jgi:hypothetical protein
VTISCGFVVVTAKDIHNPVIMKTVLASDRVLDATALVGIVAGVGMLLSSFVAPGMQLLAVPAVVILVPSLLAGTR